MTKSIKTVAFLAVLLGLFAACSSGAMAPSAPANGVTQPENSTRNVPNDPPALNAASVGCSSLNACQTFSNSSSGPGVKSVSSGGDGSVGETKLNGTSSKNASGVFGQDLSTSLFNSGVTGVSTNGTGVTGTSTGNFGVSGTSSKSVGVFGSTKFASSGKTFGEAAVEGFDASADGGTSDIGIFGNSPHGIGIQAQSSSGVGAVIAGGNAVGQPALMVIANGNSNIMFGCARVTREFCNFGSAGIVIDNAGDVETLGFALLQCLGVGITCSNGNVDIVGQYQINKNCVVGCAVATAHTPRRYVTSYVPAQSAPTMEDSGEARLQNGYTHVSLDSAFANVIDQRASYLVFITPEGDSNGVYVTHKSASGFDVHENRGGRSSIAFSYRLVAKPYGVSSPRLPFVEVPALRRKV